MTRVIVISNLRLAQAFVDYMATHHVALEIRPDAQGVEIWLADDEQLSAVQHELEQFLLIHLIHAIRPPVGKLGM